MRIVNSLVEDFGGFELDAGAVKLRSSDTQDIMLPYNGTLPEQMSSASSAFLHINVQPVQGARVVLVVDKENGRVRRPLEATNEEIIALLDRFYEQSETGLDRYWHGFWEAHYMGWRQMVKDSQKLLKMLRSLLAKNMAYISQRLLE